MLVDYSAIVSCLFKKIETYLNQQNFTKELNKVTKLEHTDLLKEKEEFCKFLTKSVMNEFLVNYVKKFEINRSLIFLTESYNINNNEKLNVLKSEVDKISETYIKYVIDQCIYNEITNNNSMLDDIEKNHDRKFPYVIKLEDDLRKKLADGFKNFKTKLSNNCKSKFLNINTKITNLIKTSKKKVNSVNLIFGGFNLLKKIVKIESILIEINNSLDYETTNIYDNMEMFNLTFNLIRLINFVSIEDLEFEYMNRDFNILKIKVIKNWKTINKKQKVGNKTDILKEDSFKVEYDCFLKTKNESEGIIKTIDLTIKAYLNDVKKGKLNGLSKSKKVKKSLKN
ncbi:hypothetical protein A0H76_2040 [Hepatospora eriocheir]|uniref:Uncharacterized protein n=1 Tax=Hepatospora eriocheir TaxID=1081669 RepID=A0A1X0QKB0_9MICR|nr:hypothetical protein A0H76_2040 [Hepatospora eriocheir]